MYFLIIYNEKENLNNKYLIRSYTKEKCNKEKNGSFIATYESIKNDCLVTKKYCIVECKTQYYFLCWDIDFKRDYPKEIIDKHDEITKYIINKINESLTDLIITANCNYVYAESSIGYGKHIYYPNIIVDKFFHLKLYNVIMKKICKEKKYNFQNCDIIDKSVCDYNGIRLFGSLNDNGAYYYPVKEKSTVRISGYIEQDFDYCLLNTGSNKYNFELKILLDDNEDIVEHNITQKTQFQYKIKNFDGEYKKIEDLLDIIKEENQKYNTWIQIGMGLHTTNDSEEMMNLWYKWSSINYNSDYDEIQKKWNSFKISDKSITLGTIRKKAKDTKYDLYVEWYNKYYKHEIIKLIKDFDQQTVALYFKNKKSENYIFKKGDWYTLTNNNLWKQMYKNDNSKLINDITETIKADLTELKNNLKLEDELLKLIPFVSKRLGTSKFICGVIDYLKDKYRNDEIEFDNNGALFGFNDCVYDLEKNIFRNYEKNDWMTITTGFDWKEPNDEEIKLINNMIKQVHIDEETRNFYLNIICSGLWGTTLQNYIILNGSGSNGKSVMNDLILKSFGNYGHLINSIILCEQRRQGANTELANTENKKVFKCLIIYINNLLNGTNTNDIYIGSKRVY